MKPLQPAPKRLIIFSAKLCGSADSALISRPLESRRCSRHVVVVQPKLVVARFYLDPESSQSCLHSLHFVSTIFPTSLDATVEAIIRISFSIGLLGRPRFPDTGICGRINDLRNPRPHFADPFSTCNCENQLKFLDLVRFVPVSRKADFLRAQR